ncbi:hypothetical protein BC941DRAFT_434362 [Chlamydoabsidia padenii]|nr:hypothetical protein BC941DRAFT_434362 [Chlamydoabsidia padenii]
MSTWLNRLLSTTYNMNQLNTLPNDGPRLVRQKAFIIDPTDPYDPFEHSNHSLSDDSSPSNSFIEETNNNNNNSRMDITQQRQVPLERIPLPQNTGDNDRVETIPTSNIHELNPWSDYFLFALWVIFLAMLSSWVYQVIYCTNIKYMPTDRLSVDPGGPSYVYIPVFQWTCWRQTWMGMHPTSALWITGFGIALYWLYLKRR